MPLTVEQFTQRLTAAGVMSEESLLEALSPLTGQECSDGEKLARELVKRKLLTKFQAEQIYAGKEKSLTLGNYVLLDKLGQGGMGMVLKAQHKRMKRVVALKVMSPAAVKSAEALKRFHREVEAAAKLTHPNIVTAFDADEAKGTHFLVMEFVDGDDLSALVKKSGPLPVEMAVQCIIQAARGLEFAHQQGVIHRDIKPANLLIARSDRIHAVRPDRPDESGHYERFTVKILDMGLARIDGAVGGSSEGAALTNTGTIMGTVDYMSPEQAMDSKHADIRSDIYSLGCSLYYLLTGKAVYDGDTMMKKLMAHRETAIPSLVDAQSRLGLRPDPAESNAGRDGVPTYERLDSVFQRMVAKRPEDRPQSMTEVIVELERCLSGASPTVASSQSSVSGDALQNFLREISGDAPSSTTDGTGSKPAKPKSGTVLAEDSASAETLLSPSDAETDPRTEQTIALSKSGEPMGVSPRTGLIGRIVRGLTPSGSPRHKVNLIVGAAALAVVLAIVFAMRPPSGTLHLEIADEQIAVTIGDTGRVVKGAATEDVRLPVGEHQLHIERDDVAFDTQAFAVAKGETVSIKVEKVGRRVRAMSGSTLLGHKESKKPSAVVSEATPAAGSFALAFDGASYVSIPTLAGDFDGPVTIEASVTPGIIGPIPDSARFEDQGIIFLNGPRPNGLKQLYGSWYGYARGNQNVWSQQSSVPVMVGRRTHVALVCDDNQITLFIDGSPCTSPRINQGQSSGPNSAFIGAGNKPTDGTLDRPFMGQIHEVRISRAARYDKSFQPASPLTADANTLALYHFDEGQGETLTDSSGNKHHGKIFGAKWDSVDSPSMDPDRRFAEQVLKTAGGQLTVVIPGKPGQVKATKVAELPKEAFFITEFQTQSYDAELSELLLPLERLQAVSISPTVATDLNDSAIQRLLTARSAKNWSSLNIASDTITDAGLISISQTCASLGYLMLQQCPLVTDAGFSHLRQLPKLSDLRFVNSLITDNSLESLRQNNLMNMELRNCSRLTDDGLKHVAAFRKLTSLTLESASTTDRGVEHLRSHGTLSTLKLRTPACTDGCLDAVATMKSLSRFDVTSVPITDTGLAKLHGLTSLTWLYLNGTQVTSAGAAKLKAALPKCVVTGDFAAGTSGGKTTTLEDPNRRAANYVLKIGGAVGVDDQPGEIKAVAKLPSGAFRLTLVNLTNNPQVTDAGLANLKDCPELTTLALQGTKVSDSGLIHFKDCQKLASLNLYDTTVSNTGLAHFKDCKNLGVVMLGNSQVTDDGLAQFKNSQALTYLELAGTKVTNAGLAHLKNCSNFGVIGLGNTQVNDAGLAELKGCKKLWSFAISGEQITDAGVAHLKEIESLRNLALYDTGITDLSLAHLKSGPKIRQLTLNNSKITNAGLANLKDNQNLTHLSLLGTPVSDPGLLHLKGCASLTELNLDKTGVTNTGLAHLTSLTKLQHLFLRGTQVTSTGIATLQTALPNCKIEWDKK